MNTHHPQASSGLGNNQTSGLVINNREKKKDKRYYGKLLVFIVVVVILVQYYIYVFQIMKRSITNDNATLIYTLLAIFHFFTFMLVWSFLVVMSTNPGEIPLYWGFYIGDDDYKRKRYCLICNAFKPERSHHCSICNVCVLNMDHHCPWVENCIGFYNRKFFMQLLFYVTLSTIFIAISGLPFVLKMLLNFVRMRVSYSDIIRCGIAIVSYIGNCVFAVVISMFFNFHLNLVLSNSTTIESLDKEHKVENEKFNVGKYQNWIQVFGREVFFWFFPVVCRAGAPEGDGLSWPTNDVMRSGSNIEMMNKSNNMEASNSAVKTGKNINEKSKENFGTIGVGSNNYKSTSPYSPDAKTNKY